MQVQLQSVKVKMWTCKQTPCKTEVKIRGTWEEIPGLEEEHGPEEEPGQVEETGVVVMEVEEMRITRRSCGL